LLFSDFTFFKKLIDYLLVKDHVYNVLQYLSVSIRNDLRRMD
jgi:hypothetical protein